MSVKPVTFYTIVCDVCGKDANEGGEFSAWSDSEGALAVFDESNEDWSVSPDGREHLCPDHNPFCTRCGKDAGELSGERDYLCPSCWAEQEGVDATG